MSEEIKRFSDGSILEYGPGKFDKWCVYLTRPGKNRAPPTDSEYFDDLVQLGTTYTNQTVYLDFEQLYILVRKARNISPTGHKLIESFSEKYGPDALRFEILFTILYAAMVAEEQKANTKLGAKIKRLGVHQILMDSPPLDVITAASFSRGMGWREIEAECKKRGF